MKMKRIVMMMAMTTIGLMAVAQEPLSSGLDRSNFDTSVRPGDDFYEYACGGWVKKNPLPAAYSRYGSFDQLQESNDKRINGILSELLNNSYEEGTIEQKLSDLYKLAMDSVRRNQEGVAPVMPLIKRLEAAKTNQQLLAIQLELAPYGEQEFFYAGFGADDKNATQNILNVYQGGLTLGQKEYYLDNDKATADIREAFKQHIVKMFQLFGFSKGVATKKMQNIMKVETALAKVSKSRTELRDPEANYNKMTLQEFQTKYPNLPLEKVMNAKGIDSQYLQEMVVGQPTFLEGANLLVGSIKPAEYRDVMEWGIIDGAANYLNDATVAEKFDFEGRVLSGRQENHPLWKRSTAQVQRMMGEALGKIYVEKYFPESSKKRMTTLVKNLQIALGERIAAQDWMNDSTKVNALLKLNTFYVKIGYPDKWTDMSVLKIDTKKSYYENVQACNKFWNKWGIDHRVGKPVDRDDWHMTPQTVNAYYNPTTNEICFPAGILQYPFFDPAADDAFNYGAIGVVIGHEMTHGFDDQGRRFDKDGNMQDWWTESDGKNFTERTDRYADFFSAISVLPDLKANGRLTLGENLADHGGLQVAFTAYKNATKYAPLGELDGLTADQRFFHAYAGVWANNITEAEVRKRTKSDPHSLGRWRVNGALPHVDAWYEAYGVKEGDKMFIPKAERLQLW
ncbi:MAG: M13 family metallopeptidase [Prevotella sp.]|nr:M13 family metallopeptidase [Prevotella sp.]